MIQLSEKLAFTFTLTTANASPCAVMDFEQFREASAVECESLYLAGPLLSTAWQTLCYIMAYNATFAYLTTSIGSAVTIDTMLQLLYVLVSDIAAIDK